MAIRELEKVYNPKRVEEKWYQFWMKHNLFHSNPDSGKKPYVIMIPPPNVTGMLTMGHVINNTIQDVLIRWKRMEGYECLWQPGTDHAGIATQNKVEQALHGDGLTRSDLGREKFIERVWEWKEKYGGIILEQLRRLGASCDWKRERFTMDEGLSVAVKEVFVRLYKKGLIYRGRKLINWCPRCNTALSDEEAMAVEVEGTFWSIAYPLKDSTEYIVVATTRPETMLGDTAVAVHPDDDRYRHLIGRTAILPLVNRQIPIIADEHADPAKGSGAVKITPAHDFDDFEVGQRHNLDRIVVIDEQGRMNKNAGRSYEGLDRYEARRQILQDLERLDLLRESESRITPIPQCYRCDTVIEPYLSTQWFVKMKPLAEPALEVVKNGRICFYPKHWEETYFHWLENVRDWCISRQIWWGHRVPVWYCDREHIIASTTTPTACPECGSGTLAQDPDVLDTWFSSWLWPFSTLGWPENTAELKTFFPGDTLITAPDIIFFWVARMIMSSLEFMGDIPFESVYFHGIIRDKVGNKMSKSKGNSPDPLWLIDGAGRESIKKFASRKENTSYVKGVPAYGADALRMTMVYLTPVGGDIRFDHPLVEFGQKFANKLWNASRFILLNIESEEDLLAFPEIKPEELTVADRWILSRFNRAVEGVSKGLSEFRLNDATRILHSYVWGEYCDWYLELMKGRLLHANGAREAQVSRSLTIHVLENILRLTHPFMPFITEEIWQSLPVKARDTHNVNSIMIQSYPRFDATKIDVEAESEIALLQGVIGAVRNIRGEMCVPPAKEVVLSVLNARQDDRAILLRNLDDIMRLARVSELTFCEQRPKASASAVVGSIVLFVRLEGIIDIEQEKTRLRKEIARMEKQLEVMNVKLANHDFITKADREVIDREKKKKVDFEDRLRKLNDNLLSLD